MKIYILKSLAALLNFLLISFVVRELPNDLAGDYILILGYIVLGALIVGLGIDTGVERYARRLLVAWSRLQLMLAILAISVVRTGLLFAFVALANFVHPGLLNVEGYAFALAFFTFWFTTLSSVLNGVLLYMASAISNLIRAALRFLIFVLPMSALSLDAMLTVELFSAGCAALYSVVVFMQRPIEISSTVPASRTVFRFLGWNYLSRLFLNLVSLNTVKILVLRSNHPNAVLFAYAIQLTESAEKFLPSVVLAGQYRPALSKAFDEGAFDHLRRRLRNLGLKSLASSSLMSLLQLAALPLAFILLQDENPAGFWPLIALCAAWLFVANFKFSLNIVSNVIEANHIQLFASFAIAVIFFGGVWANTITKPFSLMLWMLLCNLCYPFIWAAMARNILFSNGK
ncbi:hypothetical protein [Martelella mediterranea]|uniref:Polysaccharide biosynthesis protein n=1 Tax=Martelella mediterranea DSM 17316 TaxID=1122214 RepID=A0A1U9Z0B4_9HYPH|nr:hypothetical protein [Martelella mediterranea]AQZ51042.1 hypothetical protein Mame_01695 [Martelella mediterranea DSM 17316]